MSITKTFRRTASALTLAALALGVTATTSVAAGQSPVVERSKRAAAGASVDVVGAHWLSTATSDQLSLEVRLPNSCYSAPKASVVKLTSTTVSVKATAKFSGGQNCLQQMRTETVTVTTGASVKRVIDRFDNKEVPLITLAASSTTSW
jgi:hypothetical protein